jgi:hypothetical protein
MRWQQRLNNMAIVKINIWCKKEYTVLFGRGVRGKEHCQKSETFNSVEQRYRTVNNSEIEQLAVLRVRELSTVTISNDHVCKEEASIQHC